MYYFVIPQKIRCRIRTKDQNVNHFKKGFSFNRKCFYSGMKNDQRLLNSRRNDWKLSEKCFALIVSNKKSLVMMNNNWDNFVGPLPSNRVTHSDLTQVFLPLVCLS